MLNAFFLGIEKIEVIIVLTLCIAFIIHLVIGYCQDKLGTRDIWKRISEYYEQKDDLEKKAQKLQLQEAKVNNSLQKIEAEKEDIEVQQANLKYLSNEFDEIVEVREADYKEKLDFWDKMTKQNGYHHSNSALKHVKEVINASSSKRKFLKFLKEELPKANSPETVKEIHYELEELFNDTEYCDYVLEAFEDRASRCNPVLVAFELYTCYNIQNGA
ncbi:hypothetical protein [Ligilactobacillus aviarius]|uniref:hypothetical protein n=1 Tax=Ligilactobacillus aviarius TaxID=1606 RepID=UPI00249F525E|nr:hypothetical protein [Ligilactobacillus aviarius]